MNYALAACIQIMCNINNLPHSISIVVKSEPHSLALLMASKSMQWTKQFEDGHVQPQLISPFIR